MKKILNKKGFTLIELIVVIAILAILALILVPSISNYIAKATQAKNEANARTIYSEIMLGVATGDLGTGTDVEYPERGGVTCTYSVADGALTDFSCVDADDDAINTDFE
jgi:type IV pilus assembly protein PilA